MSKIIGYMIVIGLFFGLFVFCAISSSIIEAVAVFAVSATIICIAGVAEYLIEKEGL